MKPETPQQITSSKDLYFCSYLRAKGFPLLDADLDHAGRTVFHFEETPELLQALKDFYAGTALVNPASYIESFKALRSLAYSLSDSKKNMRGDNTHAGVHSR